MPCAPSRLVATAPDGPKPTTTTSNSLASACGIANRKLRRLDMLRLRRRDAPLIGAAGRPNPMVRTAHHIAVVHLQDLRGVFDHEADRIEEISEHVVAGAVPADAPGDRKPGIDHAPRAAHHRIEASH